MTSSRRMPRSIPAIPAGPGGPPRRDHRNQFLHLRRVRLRKLAGVGIRHPVQYRPPGVEWIIKTGRVPHGYLGVMVPSPEMAARMGLPEMDGAYVHAVTPGSPAAKAGIREGDIITSLDNHPVHSFSELRTRIAGIETGSQVPVAIQRGTDSITVTARIIEQPRDGASIGSDQPAPPAAADSGSGLLAGVHVIEIPPNHGQYLPPNAHGVMVSGVDDNCPAAGALAQNDVIEEIDRLPIHSVAEYHQVAGALTGRQALLSICRNHRRAFTVVTAQ